MTDRCHNFLPFIFEWEGGYTNDPQDPGGETNWGIDKRSHPNEDIKNLTKERAAQIYFDSYWTPGKCEGMPHGLGECHMDACVNCGLSRAAKFLDSCGNDAGNYISQREAFYSRLATSRPSLSKFLNGWLNRTHALRAYLKLS